MSDKRNMTAAAYIEELGAEVLPEDIEMPEGELELNYESFPCQISSVPPTFLNFTVMDKNSGKLADSLWSEQPGRNGGTRRVMVPCWVQRHNPKEGCLRPLLRVEFISDKYGALSAIEQRYQAWRLKAIEALGHNEEPTDLSSQELSSEGHDIA